MNLLFYENKQSKMINPLEEKNWNSLILDHSEYSFFHTSNWTQVLIDTYHYHPNYLVSFDNSNKLTTLIPLMEVPSFLTGKRGVSLPFTDFCELINDSNFTEIFIELTKYARAKKWKFMEFRGGDNFFSDIAPSSFYYHHSLNLTRGKDEIFSTFCSNTKRNIKKSIKENVKVELLKTPEAMDYFYDLNCKTRKKHGLPPQPYSFFQNIYKYVIAKGLGFIALAFYDNRVIAGAVFFHFGTKALYKFGASETEYLHLRPNNLIMWETIRYLIRRGFKEFSFGKTEPENDGLRRFKLGWGTSEEKIFTYKYDLRKDKFVPNPDSSKGFHNKFFRIMPIPFLKIIGKSIYRHLG